MPIDPRGAFRKSARSRNENTRNMDMVAEMMDEEFGMDPTQIPTKSGTQMEMIDGETDPMDVQRKAEKAMQPSGDDREPKRGKRTSGADPTPDMPGA